MTRVLAFIAILMFWAPAIAQDAGGGRAGSSEAPSPIVTTEDANSDLESILARQRGEDVPRLPRDFDSATGQAQGITVGPKRGC